MDKQLLKTIKRDVESLNIDMDKDDNKYYYDLIMGNLNDMITTRNNYINLIDDEENDFYIETNCPIETFQKLLDTYRSGGHVEKYGYNYDDFFNILLEEGYQVIVVKSDNRIYF